MNKACVLFLLAAAVHAASFETWETFEVAVATSRRMSAVMHSQFRQRNRLHDFFQARFGPVVRYDFPARLTLVGGYYFGESEDRQRWGQTHRTFGGVERAFRAGRGALSIRHLVEHHFGGREAPELRNRSLLQWSRPVRAVAPFVGAEVFFDQYGFIMQRLQGGLRLPVAPSYRLDLSYLFDARVSRVGESRHVIQAALRPRRKER